MECIYTIRRRKKPVLIDGKVKSQGESYLAVYMWRGNRWEEIAGSFKTMKQVKQFIADRTPPNTVSRIVSAR